MANFRTIVENGITGTGSDISVSELIKDPEKIKALLSKMGDGNPEAKRVLQATMDIQNGAIAKDGKGLSMNAIGLGLMRSGVVGTEFSMDKFGEVSNQEASGSSGAAINQLTKQSESVAKIIMDTGNTLGLTTKAINSLIDFLKEKTKLTVDITGMNKG
jgi:hypothetical protein